jgi:hypothetical protein
MLSAPSSLPCPQFISVVETGLLSSLRVADPQQQAGCGSRNQHSVLFFSSSQASKNSLTNETGSGRKLVRVVKLEFQSESKTNVLDYQITFY